MQSAPLGFQQGAMSTTRWQSPTRMQSAPLNVALPETPRRDTAFGYWDAFATPTQSLTTRSGSPYSRRTGMDALTTTQQPLPLVERQFSQGSFAGDVLDRRLQMLETRRDEASYPRQLAPRATGDMPGSSLMAGAPRSSSFSTVPMLSGGSSLQTPFGRGEDAGTTPFQVQRQYSYTSSLGGKGLGGSFTPHLAFTPRAGSAPNIASLQVRSSTPLRTTSPLRSRVIGTDLSSQVGYMQPQTGSEELTALPDDHTHDVYERLQDSQDHLLRLRDAQKQALARCAAQCNSLLKSAQNSSADMPMGMAQSAADMIYGSQEDASAGLRATGRPGRYDAFCDQAGAESAPGGSLRTLPPGCSYEDADGSYEDARHAYEDSPVMLS